MPEELLNVKECADELRVSQKKMWGLLGDKKIRFFKVDSHQNSAVRIRRSDLNAYIESQISAAEAS